MRFFKFLKYFSWRPKLHTRAIACTNEDELAEHKSLSFGKIFFIKNFEFLNGFWMKISFRGNTRVWHQNHGASGRKK